MSRGGRSVRQRSQSIPKGQLRACWCMLGGLGHGNPHWTLPSFGFSSDRTRLVLYRRGVRPTGRGWADFEQLHHMQAASLVESRQYRWKLEAELPQEHNEGLFGGLQRSKEQAETANPLPGMRGQADGKIEAQCRFTERDTLRPRSQPARCAALRAPGLGELEANTGADERAAGGCCDRR
jgi:hypothetical protein